MNENQEIIDTVLELTAGEMLRRARTTGRRKRELATIAKTLCIKEEFLDALENCKYLEIPEIVYTFGFARNYAIELGLDPDEIISKIKNELGMTVEVDDVEKEELKSESKEEGGKDFFNKYYGCILRFIKANKKWCIIGCLLVVMVFVSLILFSNNKVENSNNSTVSVVEEQTIEQKEVFKEPDYKIPVRETFETKNKMESRVILQVEKDSWIKVEDARGNTIFSRVMVTGDVYYVPLGEKYKATFGNVGAIDVWVDGRLIKPLGQTNTRKADVSMSPEYLESIGFAE